ncbi:lipopolysaccharide N-acetylmannosaminouronosyltransferase [Glaesserella sp.]|uniref:lipopolysaccharide N-acetylmannosaminouronosyltransferase n=1 Tax=Glaesserella sp. TaxID=2094731 RepID=UPI00359F31BD
MTNYAIIRGIDILVMPNQAEFVNFLLDAHSLKKGKLIAINAEKVILCEEDSEMAQLLAQSEYKYADGISVVLSIKKKYPQYQYIERIAGADLWEGLMQRAGELQIPVFLVGSKVETLKETEEKLKKQWQVNIVGTHDGYFSSEQESALIQQITQSQAKLVTVAMGSPKQEKFIQKAQKQYPDALYMGVGGTYDVFVGRVKRAPKIWRNFGLEWLYRLISQPTRWKRQLRLIKYAYYYVTKQL